MLYDCTREKFPASPRVVALSFCAVLIVGCGGDEASEEASYNLHSSADRDADQLETLLSVIGLLVKPCGDRASL